MAAGDVKGELNAEEIFELENQTAAMRAADDALTVALNFHANRRSLLQRDIDAFWKRLGDRMDFETDYDAPHTIKRQDGTTVVVEVDRADLARELIVSQRVS